MNSGSKSSSSDPLIIDYQSPTDLFKSIEPQTWYLYCCSNILIPYSLTIGCEQTIESVLNKLQPLNSITPYTIKLIKQVTQLEPLERVLSHYPDGLFPGSVSDLEDLIKTEFEAPKILLKKILLKKITYQPVITEETTEKLTNERITEETMYHDVIKGRITSCLIDGIVWDVRDFTKLLINLYKKSYSMIERDTIKQGFMGVIEGHFKDGQGREMPYYPEWDLSMWHLKSPTTLKEIMRVVRDKKYHLVLTIQLDQQSHANKVMTIDFQWNSERQHEILNIEEQ